MAGQTSEESLTLCLKVTTYKEILDLFFFHNNLRTSEKKLCRLVLQPHSMQVCLGVVFLKLLKTKKRNN